MFMHDSAGTTWQDSTLDSNRVWTGKESDAHGYMFTPRSGTNGAASWAAGGNGEVGATNGNWISTWSATAIATVNPKPARAKITAGKYNFAFSVQLLAGGTNEVRWYLYKQGTPASYWFGGTAIDKDQVTTKINGVCFGLSNGNGAEDGTLNGLHLIDVQVDYGDPGTVSVAPGIAPVPRAYALHQNYPNPFNPASMIAYELPRFSEISLVVYDILGREIARLVNGSMEAGYHQVPWNGKDARGRGVTSGVYIARMTTPEYTQSIKMLLLKQASE